MPPVIIVFIRQAIGLSNIPTAFTIRVYQAGSSSSSKFQPGWLGLAPRQTQIRAWLGLGLNVIWAIQADLCSGSEGNGIYKLSLARDPKEVDISRLNQLDHFGYN